MKQKSEPESQTLCNSSVQVELAALFNACPHCRRPLFRKPEWKCEHGILSRGLFGVFGGITEMSESNILIGVLVCARAEPPTREQNRKVARRKVRLAASDQRTVRR